MPVIPGSTPTEVNFDSSALTAPAGRKFAVYQGAAAVPDPNNPEVLVRDLGVHFANLGGVNVQAGTSYTLQASDQGKLVVLTNAASVALSLDSTLPSGFLCGFLFLGAAGGTLTPTSGTINLQTSLPASRLGGGILSFDATNWASTAPKEIDDATPAAPSGRVNVKWQVDPVTGKLSANVAATGTSGSTAVAVVVEIALTPGAPGNFTVAHGLPAAPAFALIQMDSGGEIWFQTARYDAMNLYLTASDAGIVGKAQCWLLAASAEVPFTSSIGNFSVAHGLGATPVLVQIQKTAGGGVWFQSTAADATNVNLVGDVAGITGFLEVWKILPIPVASNYSRVALAPSTPLNFSVAHGLGAVPFLAEITMTSGGAMWFQPARYDGTNLLLTPSDAGVTGYADVWAAAPSSAVISIPVTAAQGGTGLTTLPAHAVLLGEGTSPVGSAAPGAAGQVLTSNGASADPTFQAAPAGAVSSVFGRTGAVVAVSGDYTAAQVTNAADQASIQNESYSYGADSGSTNAYAITLSPAPGSYTAGQNFIVKAASTNTGSATLNVNSLGAKTIKKLDGATNLASGDIVSGQIFVVEYDGTNFQLVSPVANASGGGGGIPTNFTAGSSSTSSVSPAPSSFTDINAMSLTITGSASVRTFAVSCTCVWSTGHGMRWAMYLDGTLEFPKAHGATTGVNDLDTNDGENGICFSNIIVSIPGDSASHTIKLKWQAQGATTALTLYDRWISAIQMS
jgi:hypothetical protein